MNRFSWVQIYKEIASKLLDYENRQKELIDILKEFKEEELPTIRLTDTGKNDKKIPLTEIDPFTFFSNWNRGITKENKIRIIKILKERFKLNSPLPQDFSGIPVVSNLKSWFFGWEKNRGTKDIPNLWKLCREAVTGEVTAETFNDIMSVRGIKYNITMALFWVNPEIYINLDSVNRRYLKKKYKINAKFQDHEEYINILNEVKNSTKKPFFEFSFDAWKDKQMPEDIRYWVFQCNPKDYDVVSALKDNELKFWSVKRHKGSIKKGDKVIFWVIGSNSGCYALCTVESDVYTHTDNEREMKYYTEKSKNIQYDRVELSIDINLANNQVLKEELLNLPEFADFKGGNQGTNFTATKEQYMKIKEKAENNVRYWGISPGGQAILWDMWKEKGVATIGWNEIGNLKQYKSKKDLVEVIKKAYNRKRKPINDAKTCYDFTYTMKIGDRLLAKKGHSVILGIGEVVGSHEYDEKASEHMNIRKVSWFKVGEWQVPKNNWDKTLIEITNNPLLQEYLRIIDEKEQQSENIKKLQSKNIILYGPPGTGKTYGTINYALSIIENKDVDSYEQEDRGMLRKRFENYQKNERVGFISFHQSFSYEDFIEGIKPIEPEEKDEFLKYKIEDGIFKRMCVNGTYAIYCALQRKNGGLKMTDFNSLYLEFIANIKKLKLENSSVFFKSKTNKEVHIVEVNKLNNIVLKPKEGAISYLVSKARLSQLYKAFSKIDEIENIHDDIRNIIGGCNATFYWTIFNELKKFQRKLPKLELTDEESQEDINYETKKELVSDFAFKKYPEDVENYVLIIDEINRGNIANIFGELITLIEPDKRAGLKEALSTILPYSKTEFTVPPNLHIIGTMNTADRSVEALDTALRRRFTFIEKATDLSLIQQPSKLKVDLRAILRAINNRIEALLDKDHCIGHSYFMRLEDSKNPEEDLKQIFAVRILPLLEEYFYGDPVKIGMVLGKAFVEKKKYVGNDTLKFALGFESKLDDFERKDVYEIKDPLKFDNMEPFRTIYG
ncbi:MAG: EVE domain-containing protein [Planctomycetes bacterium]|nr:EVE domain-containing protein [Planctomycetota bacterium]